MSKRPFVVVIVIIMVIIIIVVVVGVVAIMEENFSLTLFRLRRVSSFFCFFLS